MTTGTGLAKLDCPCGTTEVFALADLTEDCIWPWCERCGTKLQISELCEIDAEIRASFLGAVAEVTAYYGAAGLQWMRLELARATFEQDGASPQGAALPEEEFDAEQFEVERKRKLVDRLVNFALPQLIRDGATDEEILRDHPHLDWALPLARDVVDREVD